MTDLSFARRDTDGEGGRKGRYGWGLGWIGGKVQRWGARWVDRWVDRWKGGEVEDGWIGGEVVRLIY